MTWTVHNGDCLEVMPTLDASSIDSIVSDPPYGLSFMGKDWDHGIPGEHFWREALRVAKPGAHLLAFGGTRTFHRLACAIEDAGWEIRDAIMWVYGSGFPKSHNLRGEWSGWGTALKPAWEPIIVARKPLDGTVAENVMRWGTGAVNVDGCRVGDNPGYKYSSDRNGTTFHGQQGERIKQTAQKKGTEFIESTKGRWPANLIHDGSDEVAGLFPDSSGGASPAKRGAGTKGYHGWPNGTDGMRIETLPGSAARFFYCAKASKADRDEGCDRLEIKDVHRYGAGIGEGVDPNSPARNRNHHPTVKPTALMRYLCRLVTPPGGVVLDPFTGSGSTGKAAVAEGFRFVGIELNPEYAEIARHRIAAAESPHDLYAEAP